MTSSSPGCCAWAVNAPFRVVRTEGGWVQPGSRGERRSLERGERAAVRGVKRPLPPFWAWRAIQESARGRDGASGDGDGEDAGGEPEGRWPVVAARVRRWSRAVGQVQADLHTRCRDSWQVAAEAWNAVYALRPSLLLAYREKPMRDRWRRLRSGVRWFIGTLLADESVVPPPPTLHPTSKFRLNTSGPASMDNARRKGGLSPAVLIPRVSDADAMPPCRCQPCRDTHQVSCAQCHGTGRRDRMDECTFCRGRGTVPCPWCPSTSVTGRPRTPK
ncbi:hypothetical protein CDCA_CDCA02G0694 [Cyanidium caldarium]|uniref:Uncharacterized protein n=1 Tax=Cyanidium caldarium TaxID=2771 RepID=A0AAV9IQY7_CYACA|nr:hypothetical protein CDCA_CDCA02G0694 [Cyanidium caldarium]|eukprot:ctg_1456.g508